MGAWSDLAKNILTRRANQRHNYIVPQFERPRPCPTTDPPARSQAKILTHNRSRIRSCIGSPKRMIACALPNRALPMRVPEEISTANTAPDAQPIEPRLSQPADTGSMRRQTRSALTLQANSDYMAGRVA